MNKPFKVCYIFQMQKDFSPIFDKQFRKKFFSMLTFFLNHCICTSRCSVRTALIQNEQMNEKNFHFVKLDIEIKP